jgi:hypothetical protein
LNTSTGGWSYRGIRSMTSVFQRAAGFEFIADNDTGAGLPFHKLQRKLPVRLIWGAADPRGSQTAFWVRWMLEALKISSGIAPSLRDGEARRAGFEARAVCLNQSLWIENSGQAQR